MFHRRVINIPLYRRFQCQFTFTWRQTFRPRWTLRQTRASMLPRGTSPVYVRPKILILLRFRVLKLYAMMAGRNAIEPSAGIDSVQKLIGKRRRFVCCIVFTYKRMWQNYSCCMYDAPDAMLLRNHNVLFFDDDVCVYLSLISITHGIFFYETGKVRSSSSTSHIPKKRNAAAVAHEYFMNTRNYEECWCFLHCILNLVIRNLR